MKDEFFRKQLARVSLYEEVMHLRAQGYGSRRISKITGVSRPTAQSWLRGSHPLNPFRPKLKPDLSPSPELAYTIGVVLGDGWTYANPRKGAHMIVLQVKDRDFVAEFNKCLTGVLGKKERYSIWIQQREGEKTPFFGVSGCSVILYKFLEACKRDLDIAKPIIDVFPADFIRGFGDSEAGVYDGANSKSLCFSNSNKPLLYYLKELLCDVFEIPTGRVHHVELRSGKMPDGHILRPSKPCFELCIHRLEALDKYAREIGFTIRRKQRKLEKAKEGYGRRRHRHRPGLSKETLEQMYLKDKLSLTKIARETGVGTSTICRWMKRCKIPRRNFHEAALVREEWKKKQTRIA